jgi:antitoxin VapB
MASTAKLFVTGRSQAVRLPKEFRFEGDEVFIRRDEETGDVVLSSKRPTLAAFFAALPPDAVPGDFMVEREDPAPERGDVF